MILRHLVFPSEIMEEADQPTEVCALDFMHLWSLMSHPESEEAQDRLIEGVLAGETKRVIAELQTRYGETHNVTLDAALALQLFNAPDARTVAEQSAANAAFGGTVAGFILGWTLFRAERPDTRASASLSSAFRMIDEACKQGRWRGGGIENLKRNIWPTFRPVAHFWAAIHIWNDKGYEFSQLTTQRGLGLFLMTSEWFRKKGETYVPTRAKAPILEISETWKIRPEVSSDWPSFEVQCNDLNAWDLRKRIKPK
jgi:hypothetical protein